MNIKTKTGNGLWRRHPGLLRAATIFIFVLLVTLPLLEAVPAMAQSVSISVSSAPPGTDITISGAGFSDGDTYQITFAPGTAYEALLTSTTVISGTSFSEVIVVPHAPWGQYNFRVATNRGNSSLLFQITPLIELNNTSGYVADILLVSGAGFRASRAVNVLFNNSNIAATSTNANGVLNPVSFQVPAIRSGNYNIYATDSTVTSPNIGFAVKPHLIASLLQGSVGDQVKLDGTGFDDNSGISILWDNQLMSTSGIFSSGVGSFTTNIIVPAAVRGTHSFIARDNSSGSGVVNFLVNPKIVINPSSGTPGSVIAITGSGFRAGLSITVAYNSNAIPMQPTGIATDSFGSFSGSFIVPGILAGNYVIRASDGSYSATASLAVASKIELNTSAGSVGTEIFVNGYGFTPLGSVAIIYDNQTLLTITANGGGAFSVSFSVPASSAGQHSITARDLTTQGVTASATFTMESAPPPETTLLVPQYSSQTDVRPGFSWSAVNDPSGVTYDLQVAWDANFSQLVFFKQGLAQAEYQVGPLEELQLAKKANPYYWRVRAVDGAGNAGNWTSPGSFYTQDSTPPGLPTTFIPPNDSQVELRPIFSWSAVSDPGIVTYDIQVAQDVNFSRLVLSKQGLTQTEYQVGASEELQLTKKTSPYYWRVRAMDEAGNPSDWTSPSLFYTEDSNPPAAPAALSPENGSKKRANILFNWASVSDPGGVTYTLEVAQDSDFNHLIIYKEGLSTTEYQLTKTEELSPSTGDPATPYYWRVRAVDGAQNPGNWSIINTFDVGGLQLSGWVLYTIIAIAGVLLLVVGIFIGTRIRPKTAVS
jgi:hypothetical protein